MDILSIVMILTIGIAILMTLFHLQRFIFFVWFKHSSKDREIIIGHVLSQLASNKIKFGVPASLVHFIYSLLENQEHGSEAASQLKRDIIESMLELAKELESESKDQLLKENPNDN